MINYVSVKNFIIVEGGLWKLAIISRFCYIYKIRIFIVIIIDFYYGKDIKFYFKGI